MIDCPEAGIRKAITTAIETGNFDALFTDSPKLHGSEHWINCLRCGDNKGHNTDEQTVVCGYDTGNEITLQNAAILVA